MYAIIEESGSQRKVAQGDQFLIDLLDDGQAAKGKSINFDRVLVVGEAGGSAKIGAPYVTGAAVTVEIIDPVVMGDKLYIHHFRRKKGRQKKTGHRQRYTMVKVTSIKA
ncbi:50S ribosomal protein L21 [Phycisphaerae bacterium]|jgi:large subunit ribosomal protein L21|nr:50S ribosomal protein L21 [Phycisphaerae bacterium]